MSGSAEIPTHVQLRQADLATAYYPCCGVGGHGGHERAAENHRGYQAPPSIILR